jgi:hypothetical protein
MAGFKSAFLPYREKSDLLKAIGQELATFQVPANGETIPAPPNSELVDAGCLTVTPARDRDPDRVTEITR